MITLCTSNPGFKVDNVMHNVIYLKSRISSLWAVGTTSLTRRRGVGSVGARIIAKANASCALANHLVSHDLAQGEEEVVLVTMQLLLQLLQLPQMEWVAKLVRLRPRMQLALASRSSMLNLFKCLVKMRVRR